MDYGVSTVNQTKNHKRYAPAKASCNDRVYLLSYQDVTNPEYGWNSKVTTNALRSATATDYAKALGAYANCDYKVADNNDEYVFDAAHWWLRSSGDYAGRAEVVNTIGATSTINVDNAAIGIRPAITLKTRAQ